MFYPTPAAEAFLSKEFGFLVTGREQDWDLEFCDPRRVEEFVQHLAANEGHYSNDYKVSLMALILASMEELAGAQEVPTQIWAKISDFMNQSDVYDLLLKDWVPDMSKQDDFVISPKLRDILARRSSPVAAYTG